MGREAAAPKQTTREVTITEGSSFAVAVSPDGRTLVTDHLGSLWTLSAEGGPGKRITDVMLQARQPAFSRDGNEIVFQGWREDGWNIWSIAPDGSKAKRLTWGPFDDQAPDLSHDGTRVAFSSDRSGQQDIWVLDRRTGELRQLTTNPAQDSLPAWSPDDREIAFVSTRSGQPGVWAVNVADGSERLITGVTGRVGAPSWTPDGRSVLYSVIADGAARLELSGKIVVSGEDVFPYRPAWLSGSEFLYAADGKIRRRALGTEQVRTVPFSATITVTCARPAPKQRDFDSRRAKRAVGIVRPTISPDGKQVLFAALGDLWLMNVGSKPVRLTDDPAMDVDPAWSPDGSQMVFSSDRAGNANLDLWVRDLKSGRERQLTHLPTSDVCASWSPDGKRVAFNSQVGMNSGADVYVVDVATGKADRIGRAGSSFGSGFPTAPTWSPDGRTVMIAAVDPTSRRYKLMAIPADGGPSHFLDGPPHVQICGDVDEGPVWSPDGSKIALIHQGLLQVVDVDAGGRLIGPLRQLTSELAHAPSWTGDSQRILYLATDQLKMVSVLDGSVQTIPLDLEWQPSIPESRLVIHAGHLWNGRDKTLETDRDIVIQGNRILSIEPHRSALHSGKVIDASDRTVMPGLIDMHVHVYDRDGEAQGRQFLAYGVTTVRAAASPPYRTLEMREAWDAGVRIGPRLYVATPAFDGSRNPYADMYPILPSLARLEMELERSHQLGYDWFKTYVRLPAVVQRRVVEFAHRVGMQVTSHEIYPAVTFGVDGTEHFSAQTQGAPKTSALGNTYGDIIQLLLGSGVPICPTLEMETWGLIASEDPSIMTDERLKVLAPEWVMLGARRRVDNFAKNGPAGSTQALAKDGRALVTVVRSGGRVVAGTDSPNTPHGISLQVELETYVKAGLTPFEALQTATVNAAEALGAGKDLGSIEAGKIADLVIVDGNPLTDIRSARRISAVVSNGRLFEVKTLLSGAKGARVTSDNR
jgi:Tol biopolymer transport system component